MLFLLQNGQSILYKSYSTDAVIQIADVVLGYPFSGVGEGAFSEKPERREGLAYGPYVQKVNLPASVTWIGAEAFAGCSLLQEVYIPESVTMIDDSAFAGSAVTIIAAPGSYAWAYAEAHGIPVMEGTHTTP